MPRYYNTSKKFLYLMDLFGNAGGYAMILDAMENQPLDEKNMTLTALGYMITLVSMPSKLWHKSFLREYGDRFCDAIAKRLIESTD